MEYKSISDLLRSGKTLEELGISSRKVIPPRQQVLELIVRKYDEQRRILAELEYKRFIG